jgi:transposase
VYRRFRRTGRRANAHGRPGKLPADQANEVQKLLQASDFFALHPKLVKEAPKS